MKAVVTRVMWVGRASVFLVGLAVILALTVGLASTVLAAVPGDPFKLGRINAISKVTQLVGTTNNALLKVDNDSKGQSATALDLQVDPKKPPIRTNSLTKVENLHADLLDGRSADQFANGVGGTAVDADNLDGKDSTAFLPSTTYLDTADAVTGKGGGAMLFFTAAPCDPGDKILNAGGGANPEDDMIEERPVGAAAWLVRIRDNGAPTTSTVVANCIDLPPLR